MIETALTPEQQDFAAEHHGLVYAFLKDNRLPYDDFYDIVVFGYLRAVKSYFSDFKLASTYEFSTIAYTNMKSELCKHYTKQNRQKRKGYTVSIESLVYGDGEALSLQEVLSVPDTSVLDFETELLMLELASRVSKRDMDVIRMKANGYGVRDIAKAQHMPMKGVSELLGGLRATVLAVCYE